ncbi:MAG: tRNA-dihydrouridine synthase [Candidatus Moranbacteria bacterium]|jgi:nifR3 family TIM-barrel protein|nr:tRNA-dihydrouridine synthase [Candidatus Moranbacteria bacterium]
MKPFLGFWGQLERPLYVLAPLANVTDAVFRAHIVGHSKPAVLWTEFVSADGLCHPKGKAALLRDLKFSEAERPIVAQLFTSHPENMREAARLCTELGFDGIDINMGCPDKNIMKQGAGAVCMKDPELAQRLIVAAREGTIAAGKELPISVKTRLGFLEDSLEDWLPALLVAKPAVITIHARTKKEMSKVPARWERIKRAVEIARGSGTLILGNGDARDIIDAEAKVAETGADGVMFGRAIFGNPWLFDREKSVTVRERVLSALAHTKRFEATWGETKSFELMKKHYQAYINHFPLAKELRIELMKCHAASEVEIVTEKFLTEHADIAEETVAPIPKL